jgi:PIN domain nuclease of toxin-antitoxin system
VKVLLDTHVFLWWSSERAARVSERVRDILGDGSNDVAFSTVSAWEIAIKVGTGRLAIPDVLERYLPRRLRDHGFEVLPVELAHALRVGSLPPIHHDPFDRMLIAQAQVEGIPLITADPAVSRYDVETIW